MLDAISSIQQQTIMLNYRMGLFLHNVMRVKKFGRTSQLVDYIKTLNIRRASRANVYRLLKFYQVCLKYPVLLTTDVPYTDIIGRIGEIDDWISAKEERMKRFGCVFRGRPTKSGKRDPHSQPHS